MSLPFSARFADLVRVYSTTEGTQPFKAGKPVPGFSSFSDTLRPGERFYYCAQSTDRPGEREVGRGTLEADGRIAREAIGGALTAFRAGLKTISLVTAAEWFEQVRVQLGSGLTSVADRRVLASGLAQGGHAVLLTEAGRAGLFLFSEEDQSRLVQADPRQALVIAPASDPSGDSGAWLRVYDGALDVRWFGALLDDRTDDGPAFAAALNLSAALSTGPDQGFYRAGPKLVVPAGYAYLGTTTLDIRHTVTIEGQSGSGQQGATHASRLRWAAGVSGIRVQRFNTSGEGTVDAVPHTGGDCSVLRGLALRGGFAGREGEQHGVHVKARCKLENLFIEGWGGDGIHIHADVSSTGPDHGNANGGVIDTVTVVNCRDGLSIAGGDANAWTIRDLDTTGNRRWGRHDVAFLCNTYVGGHSADNGLVPGSPPTVVSHLGQRYAVVAGREAEASATEPAGSADSANWLHVGPGGADPANNIPIWTAGMTVRAGGAARFGNPNSDKLVLGFYSEGGQGPIQAEGPTLIMGGTQGAGVRGAPHLRSRFGVMVASAIGAVEPKTQVATNLRPGVLEFEHSANGTPSLQWFGGDLAYTIYNSGIPANWAFRLTGEVTNAAVGKRRLDFPNGYGLGDRKRLPGSAVPTAGSFNQGDVIENIEPGLGRPIKWVCVSSGAPGSWLPVFAARSGSEAIGYAQGAGARVTQTGSKTASVVLHRACGQIVMNPAQLPGGSSASFILSNSTLETGDGVLVTIAAGATAGAYVALADEVATGSCRISLRNLGSQSLSEAVVLNVAVLKGALA